MLLVKASKDSEAGVMPTQQMWEEMDQFNEELVKAKSPWHATFCVFRCPGENSLQRGIPALDAGDKKFSTPLVKLLDKLSRISKETFHADFP